MNAYNANLINAITLIVMSAWGYFSSDSPSPTALIPGVAGLILLACSQGVKKENKMIAHVAVLITLLIILSLFMPLKGAIGRGNNMAIIRIVLMLITGIIAMVSFIKSFKAARLARENNG